MIYGIKKKIKKLRDGLRKEEAKNKGKDNYKIKFLKTRISNYKKLIKEIKSKKKHGK